MFMKNAWYIAAMADEVGRSLLQRWILDEPVVLYRTEDGKPVALRDVCPHRSLPLSMGELLGDQLRCGYHGLVFAPDGRCTRIPAQAHVPPTWCVPSYKVVEKWRWSINTQRRCSRSSCYRNARSPRCQHIKNF